MLDIGAMRTWVQHWPQGGWTDADVIARYRTALLTGLALVRSCFKPQVNFAEHQVIGLGARVVKHGPFPLLGWLSASRSNKALVLEALLALAGATTAIRLLPFRFLGCSLVQMRAESTGLIQPNGSGSHDNALGRLTPGLTGFPGGLSAFSADWRCVGCCGADTFAALCTMALHESGGKLARARLGQRGRVRAHGRREAQHFSCLATFPTQ
jgi:hypothetical protein